MTMLPRELPDNVGTLHALADALGRLGAREEALDVLRASLKDSAQGDFADFHNAGVEAGNLGDDELALQLLGRALELNREHISVRVAYASFLAKAGRKDEAEALFREAIAESPEDARAHSFYVDFLVQGGDLAKAREELQVLESLVPSSPQAARLYLLDLSHHANVLGFSHEAHAAALRKVANVWKKKPRSSQRNEEIAQVYALIGSSQADLENISDAAEAYATAINLGLDKPNYLANFAIDLVKRWSASRLALRVLEVALHKEPADDDIWRHVISIANRDSVLPPSTVMQLLTSSPEDRLLLLEAAIGPLPHDLSEIRDEILAVLTGSELSAGEKGTDSSDTDVIDSARYPEHTMHESPEATGEQVEAKRNEQEGILSALVSQATLMARLDRLESLVQQLVIAQLTGQALRPNDMSELLRSVSVPAAADTDAGSGPIDLSKRRDRGVDEALPTYMSSGDDARRAAAGE